MVNGLSAALKETGTHQGFHDTVLSLLEAPGAKTLEGGDFVWLLINLLRPGDAYMRL